MNRRLLSLATTTLLFGVLAPACALEEDASTNEDTQNAWGARSIYVQNVAGTPGTANSTFNTGKVTLTRINYGGRVKFHSITGKTSLQGNLTLHCLKYRGRTEFIEEQRNSFTLGEVNAGHEESWSKTCGNDDIGQPFQLVLAELSWSWTY